MNKKNKKSDGNALLTTTRPLSGFIALKNNKNFCDTFIAKNQITSLTEEPKLYAGAESLVYDVSHVSSFGEQAFSTILDLLMQLRAAQSDQNVFVQNNTVVREQILNNLKDEILKVSNRLTKNQIQNLEVVSSNTFDEKTLTDLIKSLLESSKKKSESDLASSGSLRVLRNLKHVDAEKISENYLSISNTVRHYESLADKILTHIYREKPIHKTELVSSGPESLKHTSKVPEKSVKAHTSDEKKKKTAPKKSESVQALTKFYEEQSVNKIGMISPILRLQSKISEISILSKLKPFVHNILKESVPRIITSQPELINKIVDKSEIEQLREDVTLTRRQYKEDKMRSERNINRAYNEIRKIYSTKMFSKTVDERINKKIDRNVYNHDVFRNNAFIKNKVYKNVFRDITKNGFKLFKDEIMRNNVFSTNLINIDSHDVTELSTRILRNKKLNIIKNKRTLLNEIRTVLDERSDQVDFNLSQNKLASDTEHITDHVVVDVSKQKYVENFAEKVLSGTKKIKNKLVVQKENIDKLNVLENKITSSVEKIYKENNLLKNVETIEKTVKKDISVIIDKKIKESPKIVTSYKKGDIVTTTKMGPLSVVFDKDSGKIEITNKRDISKFVPIYLSEKTFDDQAIENIVSRNIVKVLSPKVMRSKNLKVLEKNIYKEIANRHKSRYIDNEWSFQKDFLINEKIYLDKKSVRRDIGNAEITYKENPYYTNIPETLEKSTEARNEETKKKIDLKEVSKKPYPELLDTSILEKNIMAKTLGKNDVINLIQSYMGDLDIDTISRQVLGQIERKLAFDRRRNGVF